MGRWVDRFLKKIKFITLFEIGTCDFGVKFFGPVRALVRAQQRAGPEKATFSGVQQC